MGSTALPVYPLDIVLQTPAGPVKTRLGVAPLRKCDVILIEKTLLGTVTATSRDRRPRRLQVVGLKPTDSYGTTSFFHAKKLVVAIHQPILLFLYYRHLQKKTFGYIPSTFLSTDRFPPGHESGEEQSPPGATTLLYDTSDAPRRTPLDELLTPPQVPWWKN